MSGFDRLQGADPAVEPDEVMVARIRRRAQGRAARRFNPMSIAASLTAFALIAGGGVAVGRITAPTPTANVASTLDGATLAPSRAGMGGDTSSEKAADSYMWWGGRVILNPSGSLSDVAGVADGFTMTKEGVDKNAVLVKLADVIGAKGTITTEQNSFYIGSNDGVAPVASMYDEPMLNFYGYNRERSPWDCVREEDVNRTEDGKSGAWAPGMRVCTDEDLAPASKVDAEKAFTRVLNLLGIEASDVTKSYVDTGSPQVIMLQGNAKVGGQDTNLTQLSVSVAAKGVFNISGFAARFAEVKGYEIVGARTAAARSQTTKWSALGPNPFGDWGVFPMARDGVVATESDTGFSVDGKPGVNAYVDSVTVSKARLGLVSYYTGNTSVLLPSWIFTADDGRQWSVIALAEKYVKFGR